MLLGALIAAALMGSVVKLLRTPYDEFGLTRIDLKYYEASVAKEQNITIEG